MRMYPKYTICPILPFSILTVKTIKMWTPNIKPKWWDRESKKKEENTLNRCWELTNTIGVKGTPEKRRKTSMKTK